MKTSMKKITAMILAVVMTVTALPLTVLQVSAAELMDYYPEVDDTRRYTEVLNSNGELRFAYAYAKNDIPCDDDFRIEWSDDFYQYYTVVKVLDGTPNPGPETSGEESGSAISKYIHETSDNYKKAYLDIDQEDLEKYAGKYIKIAIIGYDQDGSYSCRSDTYFYISPPERKEPDADLDIDPSEIELGESFEYEGTAYGNDYTLNTVTVGFAYYSSESNYSKKNATDTGYLRYTGLSTDEYDVYKEIQTGSNSYLICTDETGKTTKQFYWGYVGIYTITLYAGSNEYYEEYETNIKTTKRIDVVEPQKTQIPEADIEVYPSEIELGESFEYEGTAYGNDYTLNTVTVGFTYYSSEYNYSQKIATDTGYLRYTGLSTDEYDVYKEIQTGQNSYLTCTDETGKTTKRFYWSYVGIYTITLYAGSNEYYDEYNETVKTTLRIDVISPASQIIGDINNDGEITNKDRFLLNRFLANMAGYTDIDQTAADINGDGAVNQADADYLTNHLAGIKGYESFPERDAPCLHTNCDAIYAGKTVFINNTIKNDGVHSYYHMWHYVCKGCGEDLGVFQGDDDAVKGASEKNVACTYNSDGVCSCGSIDATEYTSWTAKNITDKQISVYDTPYSTDGSYGKIFVNEPVKVLGSKAGRYLIEYTVTSTNAKKQGYVNANFLASASNYRLEFKFETITLPVSGRTVLLIPKNGSAFYHLYDGDTKITDSTLLKDNLKIIFENNNACDVGTTTITGKVGGLGTLAVAYTVNGVTYNLQCPDYYIVADSSEIYTSDNINAFSDEEEEYISTALDIYFSQDDINVPYELYWSAGENFALCIEELDKILASLISIESPTTQDYAGVLAVFIEKYTQAQENGTTVDELSDIAIAESLWKIIKFVDSAKSVPEDVKTIVTGIQSVCISGVKTPEQLKKLFTLTYDLITNKAFVKWVQSSNELSALLSEISKVGVSVQTLAKKLEAIISNSKFWSKALGILNVAWGAKDALEHIVVFSITTFGNWQRHRECLSMMLTAIDSIPTENRTKNYKVLRAAVVELLDKYDEEFWDRLNDNLKTLASNTIVWGTKLLVAYACPGAMAVFATAQFFVGLSNVREEADMIRMRQFYLIMNQAIFDEFKNLYDEGDTFSTIYLTADDLVKMFLNMAIYTNDLAQEVSEYTEADKAVYEKNIEKIKTKFKIYLDLN